MNLMTKLAYGIVLTIVVSSNANAWFIFIPIGAIARALETDPDSISVSSADRALGKCAGLHVNQAQKFSTGQPPFPDDNQSTRQESPESIFHSNMANVAVEKASEKNKVKDLANAYSARWGRVAGADQGANRAYGADLARNCIQNDIPIRSADLPAWQTRQDAIKAKQLEEERRRTEEAKLRLMAEDEARHARLLTKETLAAEAKSTQSAMQPRNIDFSSEARKSARVLNCATEDVRVIGVDGQNILFAANCREDQTLVLTCDPSGLCLRK